MAGDYGPTPQFQEANVMYREADFIGNSSHVLPPASDASRRAKGDIGFDEIEGNPSKWSKRLSKEARPFGNLRKR